VLTPRDPQDANALAGPAECEADDGAGGRQQRPTDFVEVVGVLIVTEQHDVERQQAGGGDRRAGDLA
jgi:hypothetical protein